MRSDHLKKLMHAVQKTVPDNDPGTGFLVNPEEVCEELEEVREKSALIERFKRYRRVDDLFEDFSIDAAKQLVFESQFGRTSNDRRAASKEVLDRALGKPVDRVLNITAEVNQLSDQELESKIESILDELGYKGKERKTAKKLIIEESPPGQGEAEEI